jgi:hypothetical protein
MGAEESTLYCLFSIGRIEAEVEYRRLFAAIPQDRHRPATFASEERERGLASDSQPSVNSWSRGNVRTVSIFTGCFADSRFNAGTTGNRSPFALRFTISPAVIRVSSVQLDRLQEPPGVRWAVPAAEAVASIRTANRMAFMAMPLKCQMPLTQRCPVRLSAQRALRDHNRANAVRSWCLPLFKRPVFLGSTICLTHPRFRGISMQSFLVSRFEATTWPMLRSLWRKFVQQSTAGFNGGRERPERTRRVVI